MTRSEDITKTSNTQASGSWVILSERGVPERDMLLLGAGGEGEGPGRPDFDMNRRRRWRRVRILGCPQKCYTPPIVEKTHKSYTRNFAGNFDPEHVAAVKQF